VLEETGCDIEELVREEDFIELTLDGKRNKLYIVAGLDPDSAQFAPKCRGVREVLRTTKLMQLKLETTEDSESICRKRMIVPRLQLRLWLIALSALNVPWVLAMPLQEIGGYAWHRVADLPANRDEGGQTFLSEDGVKHKFFMVSLGWIQLSC
jgi:hypothetical protein